MIDDLGGVVTEIGNAHITVFLIDGEVHLADNDGDFDVFLTGSECHRLANLLLRAEKRSKR